MAFSDTKTLLGARDRAAPCIVDMSPSANEKPCKISLCNKMDGLSSVLSKKEVKKKRVKSSHCCNRSGVSCWTVILVLLLIGQFLWTLSLQFSVLRVFDKVETIEKIAYVALDLTTEVATSAAKAATQSEQAANIAIQAVISMELTGFKNLTEGEMLLAAAVASKKQAESAALAAREHAIAAAVAKNKALAATLEIKETIESVVATSLVHLQLPSFIPEDQERGSDSKIEVDALPPISKLEVEGATRERIVIAAENDIGKQENQLPSSSQETDALLYHFDSAAEILFDKPVSSSSGTSESYDDKGAKAGRGAARSKRSINENTDGRSHGERRRIRHSRSPKNRQVRSAIHLLMNVEITEQQEKLLNEGKEEYIALDHGRMTKEGYEPRADVRMADFTTGAHTYKEWSGDEDHKGHLIYNQTSGHIVVKRAGLYHVYAQIYYRNWAIRNHFEIRKRSKDRRRTPEEEDEKISLCITSRSTLNTDDDHISAAPEDQRSNDYSENWTCHTSTTVSLSQGDSVYLYDSYGTRIQSDKFANFFGMFKIVDT